VHLADYVVSYSLQINNRCLRYLAECDLHGGLLAVSDSGELMASESYTVFTESLIARDTRRLASMWSLMRPGWKGVTPSLADHGVALLEAANALADGASNRRLAFRLAGIAGTDDEAQAILKIARKFPGDVAMGWESLNEIFTQDSENWRNSEDFRAIDDNILLNRIARRYRKSYRLAALIPVDDLAGWLDKHGHNLHRWVQLCAHQLELLRPGLSDSGKECLWYLDKMSDSLRTREGLARLSEAVSNLKVKKSAAKLAQLHIDQQIGKMDKRIKHLAKGCFSTKPKAFAQILVPAVTALGLRDVSLMKKVGPVLGSVPEQASDNEYGS